MESKAMKAATWPPMPSLRTNWPCPTRRSPRVMSEAGGAAPGAPPQAASSTARTVLPPPGATLTFR